MVWTVTSSPEGTCIHFGSSMQPSNRAAFSSPLFAQLRLGEFLFSTHLAYFGFLKRYGTLKVWFSCKVHQCCHSRARPMKHMRTHLLAACWKMRFRGRRRHTLFTQTKKADAIATRRGKEQGMSENKEPSQTRQLGEIMFCSKLKNIDVYVQCNWCSKTTKQAPHSANVVKNLAGYMNHKKGVAK